MEIVCKKCGTLNPPQSIMCIRCGQFLETEKVKKYQNMKGKLVSGSKIVIMYVLLFIIYIISLVYIISPFITKMLEQFGNSYIFEFYNNSDLTKTALETIYTIIVFLVNYIFIAIILEIIMHNKVIEFKRIKNVSFSIYFLTIISFLTITYLKFDLNSLLMLEHVISAIIVFPYIKRKLLKKCIK